MSEIQDRRQRAREAYADTPEPRTFDAVESAIEVATTIKLTPEAVSAFRNAEVHQIKDPDFMNLRISARLAAALTALGFEVID